MDSKLKNDASRKTLCNPTRLTIAVLSIVLAYTIITHQDFGGNFLSQPEEIVELIPTPELKSEELMEFHLEEPKTTTKNEKIWTLDTADLLAEEFRQVAIPTKTDKVTTHKYQYAYAKYLATWRDQKRRVKLLEIGLGCRMKYGPGASYHLWHNYFEGRADIYFVEHSCNCAEKWQSAEPRPGLVKIYCGDQADPDFLRSILKEAEDSGELFDFIVDDGGHRMLQQQVSLEYLLPAVKKGGIYVLEDLLTSYKQAFQDEGAPSTVDAIKTFIDTLNERVGGKVTHAYSRIIKAFECMPEICIFTTKS